MKIVIVGAGMVGASIARELVEEKKDVILIEKDPEKARFASNALDCLVLNEDGIDPETLKRAGTEDADWFISLMGTDEANIVACGVVSSAFPKPRTIARVRSSYYGSLGAASKSFLGVDHVINPEIEAAQTIVQAAREGISGEILPLREARIRLRSIPAAEDPRFPGHTIQEIRKAVGLDFLIPAVVRDGGLTLPAGDFEIQGDDLVYLLAEPKVLDVILGPAAEPQSQVRKVLIVGATTVGERVVEGLLRSGQETKRPWGKLFSALAGHSGPEITVIDDNREHAKRFAHRFPSVTIVNRDLVEEDALEREGAGNADLVVCVTGAQSYNILTARLAKELGARRAIALLLNNSFIKLAPKLELDALVSMRTVVGSSILNIIRKANIRTLHAFHEDDVELVELSIQEESPAAGRKVRDLGLPKGALVAFVLHGTSSAIPTGDTLVQVGDTVGILTKKGLIERLEEVFGGRRGR
ncbi:MAG TPA: FAD-dependent oxidoreductase [Spirochaetia bacterium]|nr:FAD-dependent oxidoreductase [Spirochaetales bacterium]HRY80747.1 FAD-dependent oxidoreductase [Spirochaetia bacterium]